MAKRKPEEAREVTRKETRLRRKDAEANRRVLLALGGVGVLLLLIIVAGVVQELLIRPNQPVITVNNQRLSTRDYQKLVKYAWFQGGQATDPQGTGLDVLDEAIDTALLEEQAQQRGITVSDEEVTETIEKLFGYYRVPPTPAPTLTPMPEPTADPDATPVPTLTPAPTPTLMSLESFQTTYQNYLNRLDTATGMTQADFRALIRRDLIRQKLYEDVTKDVPTTAEQVHVRHILVAERTPAPTATPLPEGEATPTPDPAAPTPTPTLEPRDEAQALARIIEIQQRIGAGEDFAELAREFSDDPGSKDAGGDLGWFPRDSGLVKEFEDAAFALQPGEVSGPVKTQFGYHLIKMEERDPNRPLDDYTVAQEKYAAYQEWLANLRNAATVTNNWAPDMVPPTPSAGSAG
ncbi:MAG: Foldase protein PrsA 1 precursor [Chloroflexi bacterium ADurb.Bin325]|nr:MAG: Foldase protein PrsA 1 precursor [Chloroflexi bacterium ADurb.Bin325]